jgi:hypothetical protein
MALTAQQLTALKADILADATLNALPNNSDGAFAIAAAYKLDASPDFYVWKSSVSIQAVGSAFNGTELAGLTTGNQTRLQTIAYFFTSGVNPSQVDTRQMFDDIFSGAGGATTRANLLALWKRKANRAEKLFATGVGSSGSPATMTFEGSISYTDVLLARA